MSKKSRKQRERKRQVKKEQEKLEKIQKPMDKDALEEHEMTRQVRLDSLNYLLMWKEQKAQWKFKKSRQVWCLKNMYSIQKMPTKHFKIMKKYVEGLEGKLKEKVLQDAL